MKNMITFHADSSEINKMQSRKSIEIVQIVLYLLLFFLSVIFRDDDSIRELAHSFDTKKDTIRSWMNFITIISIAFVILSAALAGHYSGKLKRLEASCVVLEPEQVSGTCFSSDTAEPAPFAISYDRISGAYANENTEGLNLTITSKSGASFQCLSIENPSRAAKLINEQCCEQTAAAAPAQKTCSSCGSLLNPNAVFCDQCGATVSKAKATALPTERMEEGFCVEPVLVGALLKCPVCDHINRKGDCSCASCGVEFILE